MKKEKEEMRLKCYGEYEKEQGLKIRPDRSLVNAPVFEGSYFESLTEQSKVKLDRHLESKQPRVGMRLNTSLYHLRKKLRLE